MKSTGYHHIELRDGVPWIRDTEIKVVEIARDFHAGWDGQQIYEQYPWITMPQIDSALAYYFEHKEEIDEDSERRDRSAEAMLNKLVDPEFMARAQELKRQRAAKRASPYRCISISMFPCDATAQTARRSRSRRPSFSLKVITAPGSRP